MAAAADVLSFTPGMKQSKMAVLMTQEDMEEEQRLVSWLTVSLYANTDLGAVCRDHAILSCMDGLAARSSQS